jgi:predicted RNA binding protein YcfA (HicA-like mRNA interferase family)/predicted RNase H-like HicB family nuclease
MPKARQVLAGLTRDGWVEVQRRGSHRTLRKGLRSETWAYHDGRDLGGAEMARNAKVSVIRLPNCGGSSDMKCTMNLRVEYYHDPESRNWGFEVPSLHIIGGADTREEAEQQAIEAIEFTLWSDDQEPIPDGSEVGYLTVTVESQAKAGERAG